MKKVGLILDAESIADLKKLAQEAEDANFDSIWATELYRTSFQQLSSVAQSTHTIRLGTAVALAFARSPLITTLTALDLDEISDGRFVLGLGTGAKRTNEMWHGLSFTNPVARVKECIEIIRLLMQSAHLADPVAFKGEFYDVSTRGYRRVFKPFRKNIPVYLAGVGGDMVSAAGAVADGYLGHVVCSLRYIKEIVGNNIKKGLAKSGRSKKDFQISSIITCAISEDRRSAVEAAKATVAFYATVRTYEPPFKLHGFEREAAEIREAFFRGDVRSMIKGVSDDMVDAFAVVGNADECRRKIDKYLDYIDLPILSAPHYYLGFDEVRTYQRAILEVFGG